MKNLGNFIFFFKLPFSSMDDEYREKVERDRAFGFWSWVLFLVHKSEGNMIKNQYIVHPGNNQKTLHLNWPFNKVKCECQILDFRRGASPRCRASPATFSKLIFEKEVSLTCARQRHYFDQGPTKFTTQTHSLYVHFGCCFGSLSSQVWGPFVDP